MTVYRFERTLDSRTHLSSGSLDLPDLEHVYATTARLAQEAVAQTAGVGLDGEIHCVAYAADGSEVARTRIAWATQIAPIHLPEEA